MQGVALIIAFLVSAVFHEVLFNGFLDIILFYIEFSHFYCCILDLYYDFLFLVFWNNVIGAV